MDPAPRPRWALPFPLAVAFAVAIGLLADLELLGFDGAVFAGHDKILHFALYGACGLLAVGWFHRRRPVPVLGAVALLVVVEEASQGLFAHRSVDALDAVASVAGIAICGALGVVLSRISPVGRSGSASRP